MENEKRIATSNAEMVTISRAEYESQQTQLTELKLQNQWLLEQLGLAKKRQFGSSSEKLQEGLMDQLSLSFNELEAYAYGTKSATPEQVAVKAHARKKQSGSVTEIVPEGTPTEVVEHRLSEEELICSACGSKMEEIGKEVRRSLQMEPARFWIREDVYYTYACRKCEQDSGEANILKTPKEPALLPGSYASAEAVAHIAVQKFVMYSPLYRLEQEFHRQGLKLSRQTMSNWLLNVSDTWLQPIYEVLHRQLCREKVLHGDETTLQVLKEPGKAAPKSALGRALHYLLEQWPYLIRYLEDGRLELSNNRAERSIKPFVMGRKNWLFANTPGGAQSSSVIYSLIETAKENGLDPYRYLLWVLRNAPAMSQMDEAWAEQLLPASAPQECRIPKE
nr:transposase [Butyricicoccus sp. OF30-11pH9A]